MSKTININELRHLITFETKTVGAVDAYGQRTSSWATARSLWAKREQKSSSENNSGDRKVQVTKHIFTVRYVEGLWPTMRISDVSGNRYSIQAIYDKEGLRKHLVIETTLDDSNKNASVV